MMQTTITTTVRNSDSTESHAGCAFRIVMTCSMALLGSPFAIAAPRSVPVKSQTMSAGVRMILCMLVEMIISSRAIRMSMIQT